MVCRSTKFKAVAHFLSLTHSLRFVSKEVDPPPTPPPSSSNVPTSPNDSCSYLFGVLNLVTSFRLKQSPSSDSDDEEPSTPLPLPPAPTSPSAATSLLLTIISETPSSHFPNSPSPSSRRLWLFNDDGKSQLTSEANKSLSLKEGELEKISNPNCLRVKELAVLEMGRLIVGETQNQNKNDSETDSLITFLQGSDFQNGFFLRVSKSKGAKIIRSFLDVVTPSDPEGGMFR